MIKYHIVHNDATFFFYILDIILLLLFYIINVINIILLNYIYSYKQRPTYSIYNLIRRIVVS